VLFLVEYICNTDSSLKLPSQSVCNKLYVCFQPIKAGEDGVENNVIIVG